MWDYSDPSGRAKFVYVDPRFESVDSDEDDLQEGQTQYHNSQKTTPYSSSSSYSQPNYQQQQQHYHQNLQHYQQQSQQGHLVQQQQYPQQQSQYQRGGGTHMYERKGSRAGASGSLSGSDAENDMPHSGGGYYSDGAYDDTSADPVGDDGGLHVDEGEYDSFGGSMGGGSVGRPPAGGIVNRFNNNHGNIGGHRRAGSENGYMLPTTALPRTTSRKRNETGVYPTLHNYPV
jgi:hypothetical protein